MSFLNMKGALATELIVHGHLERLTGFLSKRSELGLMAEFVDKYCDCIKYGTRRSSVVGSGSNQPSSVSDSHLEIQRDFNQSI